MKRPTVHARALEALRPDEVIVSLTDLSGGSDAAGIEDAAGAATAPFEVVTCVDDSDGGIVDWTQRLVGSAKERCFISGLGIDRVALAIGPP